MVQLSVTALNVINPMHTQPESHSANRPTHNSIIIFSLPCVRECFMSIIMRVNSKAHFSKQFDKTGVRAGYCTGNEQLSFVATVNAGRDTDRCAVTLRWQYLEPATPHSNGRTRRPLLPLQWLTSCESNPKLPGRFPYKYMSTRVNK